MSTYVNHPGGLSPASTMQPSNASTSLFANHCQPLPAFASYPGGLALRQANLRLIKPMQGFANLCKHFFKNPFLFSQLKPETFNLKPVLNFPQSCQAKPYTVTRFSFVKLFKFQLKNLTI